MCAETLTRHLAFALDAHRALAPVPTTGSCFSPFSVGCALGLLATGAGGSTRAELLRLLTGDPDGDPAPQAELLTRGGELEPGYDEDASPVLALVNALWVADRVVVRDDWRAELARWPGGEVRPAPFRTDSAAARAMINDEVAATTRGLVPTLLGDGDVHQDTTGALVTALYLKTGWYHPFVEHATAPEPFHTPRGVVEVPTMRLAARLAHAAADGWQLVRLPAAGGVEAVVLLPDTDLATAEAALTAEVLTRLLDTAGQRQVELYLPRLRVESRCSLGEPLRALGVHTVFTDGADLRGISADPPMRVDAAVHQAVLRVDEQGLEGAAATAMLMMPTSAVIEPEAPVVVRVDRPFLLLVRHRSSGAVYFLARVTDPRG